MVDAATMTGRFLLAFVFLSAALPKLVARADFQEAVANYALLPARFVPPVARLLPPLELVVALALFAAVASRAIGLLVAALLLLFSTAVAVNLARGREIDCGCSHSVAPRRIGWRIVVVDVALAAIAVLVALSPPESAGGQDTLAALALAGSLFVGAQLLSVGLPIARTVRRLERELAG